MKNLFTLAISLLLASVLIGQTPKSFKYQAVARDINSDPIVNQTVSFRFSILFASPAGSVVYQETQSAMTNDFGLVNLSIGTGSVITGDLNDMDWEYPHYLKVEMDPAGGSSYINMGNSKMESVPYALYDGDWEIYNDNLLLSVPGNVSIGSGIPSSKLQVQNSFPSTNNVEDIFEIRRASTGTVANGMGAGMIFRNEVSNGGFALSGRIASVMELVGSPSAAGMLFQTRPTTGIMNSAMYIDPYGNIGLSNTNPSKTLDINGNFNLDYPGISNGLTANANASYAVAFITNDYAGNTYGLSAGVSSSSAGSSSFGVYGFNYGIGYGLYGKNYNAGGIGTYGINTAINNFGYLGSSNYGTYGENYYGNYGYLGGNNYGVYGSYNGGNWGSLGSSQYGVYGYLITTNPGNYGIYGYGVNAAGEDGTDYGVNYTLGGVKGYNYYGNPYTFGVAGYSFLDYNRSGSCFGGKYSGLVWGSMGYQSSSGTEYGGYFTTYTAGAGKDDQAQVNSGFAAYGDLFGADIHGKVYGAFIEGENYATFAKGNSYHSGLDIHLQENGSSQNTVLYTSVATDATIQTSGFATISNGKVSITFNKSFSDAVSENEPIIVTVTPMGNSNGVYLSQIDKGGFSVVENNNGKSNVTVSYIAIGKRKGYESPQLPAEVIAADYTTKLAQGLHNDNDMKTDGQGLYYENGQLIVGKHSSTLPDLNKQPEEIPTIAKPEPRIDKSENDGKGPEPEEKQ